MDAEEKTAMGTEAEVDDELVEPEPAKEEAKADESEAQDDEQKLAEEAVALAEEEREADPKDAVIGEFRRKTRDAELEAARLRGELDARDKAAKPEVKGPETPTQILADIRERDGLEATDALNVGQLEEFEQRKERSGQQTSQIDEQNRRMTDYNEGYQDAQASMTDAQMGEGLGIEALIQLGGGLLTPGDKLDVFAAGKKCGQEMIDKLKYRILKAKGPNADELRQRLSARKTQVTNKTTNKDKPEKKKKKEEAPSQEEILSPATVASAQIDETFGL